MMYLSSLMEQESYKDYKKTQQEVFNVFLYYIYYYYKSYSKLYMLFIIYHTITTRWICYSYTHDIIPYDTLYDCSHILLHYPRNKREIKSKKMN